jgi:hypothetical protein
LEEQLKVLELARAEAEKSAKSKGVKGAERLIDEDDVIEALKVLPPLFLFLFLFIYFISFECV